MPRLDLIRHLVKLKLRLMPKDMQEHMPKPMQEYPLKLQLESMEYLHQAVLWQERVLELKQEDL